MKTIKLMEGTRYIYNKQDNVKISKTHGTMVEVLSES